MYKNKFFIILATNLSVLTCACVSHAAGGPLWEDVDPAGLAGTWKQLANERVMYPMEMENIAVKIGGERQLFVDNYLIATTEKITRQVHQPRRYEGNPVLLAAPREWVFVHHVMQSDESPRFRMWYWSMPAFYEWKGDKRIRNGTGYAVSEDGIHWERPELDLYRPVQRHSNGGIKGPFPMKNIVMPYGMMDGLFYEPWETNPNKRYKAIVGMEALKTDEDGRMLQEPAIPSGWYLHWSPDGIHWQADLSHPVLVAAAGYVFPIKGLGDTSTFWWDSIRKKYMGDAKLLLPGPVRRCRGFLESDDLIHWTRPRPAFYGRRADHQIYGHNGFVYEGMYLGFRWIYDRSYMDFDKTVHAIGVELDCSRDGQRWTRVGAGQPFMALNPKRDTWDADEMKPIEPLVVGDELWIYYASRPSPAVFANIFAEKKGPRVQRQDVYSTGLAKLRLDGFASLNGGEETGTVVTRPLTFKGKTLHINADVADGGEIIVGFRTRDGKKAVDGFVVENCAPLTGDSIDMTASWNSGEDISKLSGSFSRLEFKLRNAKIYSFWME